MVNVEAEHAFPEVLLVSIFSDVNHCQKDLRVFDKTTEEVTTINR